MTLADESGGGGARRVTGPAAPARAASGARTEAHDGRIGRGNAHAALLRRGLAGLRERGMDPDAFVAALSPLCRNLLADEPALDALFRSVAPRSRAKLVELLVGADRIERARTLAGELPPAERADMQAWIAILAAYRRLDYETGRQIAPRCRFGAGEALDPLALSKLAFEFLDSARARAMLDDPARRVDGWMRGHVLRYLATLEPQGGVAPARFESGRAGGGPDAAEFARQALASGDHAGLLDWCRERADPASLVRVIPGLLPDVTEWHVRMALVSVLRATVLIGWTDDFEAFSVVLDEMVKTSREGPALDLFLTVDFRASAPVTFAQFKRLQRVLIAARSVAEQEKAARRALERLSPHLSSSMTEVLVRPLAGAPMPDPVLRTVPARAPATSRSGRMGFLRRWLGRPPAASPCAQEAAPERTVRLVRARRPEHGSGRRVALCIAGQLRSFAANWPVIRARVAEPLGADVFVSTWDKVGFGIGYQEDIRRFLPEEIVRLLPPACTTLGSFRSRFPRLMASLEGFVQDSAELLGTLPDVHGFHVWDETSFDRDIAARFPAMKARMAANQLKMLYTMQDSLLQAQAHARSRGAGYDILLRLRPDCEVEDFCAPAVLAPGMDGGTVHVNHYHALGISDQFAFGSDRAMSIYLSAFDAVWRERGFKIHELGFGVGAEALMFDRIAFAGLRCVVRPVISCRLSSRVLPASICARKMLEDAAGEEPISAGLRALLEQDLCALETGAFA